MAARTDTDRAEALFGLRGGGQVEPGNIDLRKQPRVKNPDGSTSTVRSMSINEDGLEILIPTVAHDGRGVLSDEDAIRQWRTSGKHLGKFKTSAQATSYAKRLHEAYARGEYRPVTVRLATEDDAEALLEMGRRFIESSAYRGVLAVVPSRQADVIETLLGQGGCWVLEPAEGGSPVGMLGIVLAPLPLTGELAALEAMWWVEPLYRGTPGAMRMWRWAEAWALAQGATCIQMLQPVDQTRLATVYARRGYTPVETTWHKRLSA